MDVEAGEPSWVTQPYYEVLDKMQSNKTRLFNVALSFGYFIKFWK